MLIKCIYNTFANSTWHNATEFHKILQIGAHYVVFGICFDSELIYEIIISEDHGYTIEVPAKFFEVIDNRLSKYFVIGRCPSPSKDKNRGQIYVPYISYREVVEEEQYFENLINGSHREVTIFESYKELIMLEFAIPSIIALSRKIGAKAYECYNCKKKWDLGVFGGGEMIRCPFCHSIQLKGDDKD